MSDLARLNGDGMDMSAVEMTTEPRTLDIEIDPPIVLNNTTYSTLHLVEPTAMMVQLAEQELSGSMSVFALRKYQIALVAQGSKTPLPVIQRMRISQVREAADFLSGFIGGGPQTGES